MTSPYLKVESITVAYGSNSPPVLDGVSLDVQRGEMVALLGSSGCGKTTLLRSIAGFVKPSAGRIVVDGRDITALPPEARHTAMMFQSYALWPHMDVAANIGYGLRMRGVDNGRIAVDARLDEPAWSEANWRSDFTQKEPVEGGTPSASTDTDGNCAAASSTLGGRVVFAKCE